MKILWAVHTALGHDVRTHNLPQIVRSSVQQKMTTMNEAPSLQFEHLITRALLAFAIVGPFELIFALIFTRSCPLAFAHLCIILPKLSLAAPLDIGSLQSGGQCTYCLLGVQVSSGHNRAEENLTDKRGFKKHFVV